MKITPQTRCRQCGKVTQEHETKTKACPLPREHQRNRSLGWRHASNYSSHGFFTK